MSIVGSPLFIFVCLIPLHGILAAPNAIVRPSLSDKQLPGTKSKCEVLDDIIRENYSSESSGSGMDMDGEIVVEVLKTGTSAEDICSLLYNATQVFCRLLEKKESMYQLKEAKDEFKSRFDITDELCDVLNNNKTLPSFAESARSDDPKKTAGLIFCQLRLKMIEEKRPLCRYFASSSEERSSNSKPLRVRPLSNSASLSRFRRSEANGNDNDEENNANGENSNNSSTEKSIETKQNLDASAKSDAGEKINDPLSVPVIPEGDGSTDGTKEQLGNENERVPESSTIVTQSKDSVSTNDENDKTPAGLLATVGINLLNERKQSTEPAQNNPTTTPNSISTDTIEAITTELPQLTTDDDDDDDLDIGSRFNDAAAESKRDALQRSIGKGNDDDDDDDYKDSTLTPHHEGVPGDDGLHRTPLIKHHEDLPTNDGFPGTPMYTNQGNSPPNDGVQGSPSKTNHENLPPNDGVQGTPSKTNHENLPPNDGVQGTMSTVPPTNAAGTLFGTYTRHSIIFGLILIHVNFYMIFNSMS